MNSSDKYHYDDVIMGAIASQITSLTIVYSTVYSGADQSKHQSSASLAFVWGIHRGPVNSPHKWPVTQKMFPFDDVIMWVVHGHQQKGRITCILGALHSYFSKEPSKDTSYIALGATCELKLWLKFYFYVVDLCAISHWIIYYSLYSGYSFL